jgi:regulator of replication initiation timing
MNRSLIFLLAAALLVIAVAFNPLGTKAAPMKPLPIDKELMEEPEKVLEMEKLKRDNEYLEAANSDLQDEINYLIEENERLEARNAELGDIIQTPSTKDTAEESSEEYIDITIIKFWGYTECKIYGTPDFCTKLDVLINNAGTDTIYFNPYSDTWLMDDSLVQYNIKRTGDDSEFRSGEIYPDTVKRGYLYYYPPVPLKSKTITFYAGINGEAIKKEITQ